MNAPSVSEQIRCLAKDGVPVAEIARSLGIRYQHAYKVCRDGRLNSARDASANVTFSEAKPKSALTVTHLLKNGFIRTGVWTETAGRIACSSKPPDRAGVYAYAVGGSVMYVGLASGSLAKRLYQYGNPGPTQKTNIRLNTLIRNALAAGSIVEVFHAHPPSIEWNDLRISGSEGLEAALIQDFALPWNVRGAA